MSAPGWPPAVTRVEYGSTHDALPSFLLRLAPVPPETSDSLNSIEFVIGDTPTFGRKREIALIVSAALHRQPAIITGAPGMGKSKVAVAAAHDPQITARFGRRRVFVSLDYRSDPLDLLILLASEMGLAVEPTLNSALAAIRYACRNAPTFAILDNVEQLIEADETGIIRNLDLLRNIPNLSFVVTSRESLSALSGWEKIDDLAPLGFDEARDLFCAIATSIQPNDTDLRPLLIALDGHALSLTIMAGRVDGDLLLKPMLERWKNEKATLLRQPGSPEDRRNSVQASLRLSLTSRHMNGMANRLLAILGFLPDGLPAGGLKAFLGREDIRITAQKSGDATTALRRLRLIVPRPDGSVKLLNPLRECVIIERPLKSPDLDRVLSAGLKILKKGKFVGTDTWPVVRAELSPHIGNLARFLVEAGRAGPLFEFVPVIELARRISQGESRFEEAAFLHLAEVLDKRTVEGSRIATATAMQAAGDLALRRNDLETAKIYLEKARNICVRIDNGLGEANVLRTLGELALRHDDLDGAKTNLHMARDICVRIDNGLGEANVLRTLGELALRRDDLDGAKTNLHMARDIYARIGDSVGEANALRALGNLALRRDDLDGAKTNLDMARDICIRIGDSLGEANALRALGELALRRNDFDGAKSNLDMARDIYIRIDTGLGEANALRTLGELALRRDDLDGAKTNLHMARDICVRIGDSVGEANALRTLGELALRRDDLVEAKDNLDMARDIFVRIGDSVGEANALLALGELALRRDDLDDAKDNLEMARDIYIRIDASIGEANTSYLTALISAQNDLFNAAKNFEAALKKYQATNDPWGIAHTNLRLGQIAALRGDFASLRAAAENVLAYETSHPSKRGAAGWRAFCANLTETDSIRREAMRDEARAAWTNIGALGLVRDYIDFKIELTPESTK